MRGSEAIYFRQLQLAPRRPKGSLHKIINMKTPPHTLIGILPLLPVRKDPVPFPLAFLHRNQTFVKTNILHAQTDGFIQVHARSKHQTR
jgi:hypothetical protein